MWESYKQYSKEQGYEYDDELIMRSIEQTHKIAFERIESFLPDNTVRLPEFVVPAGFTATQALVNYALEGLKDKGFVSLQGVAYPNVRMVRFVLPNTDVFHPFSATPKVTAVKESHAGST